MPKQLLFDDRARLKMQKGVSTLADVVVYLDLNVNGELDFVEGQPSEPVSITDGDELAITLRDSGTIRVGEETYGGFGRATFGAAIFDEAGAVIAPRDLAEEMLIPQKPGWIRMKPFSTC